MTIKTKILIFCLIILFSAGLLAYRRFYRPSIAAARQQEEAVKLAQLEADLIKAAEAGHRSNKTSQRHTRRPTKTRRT